MMALARHSDPRLTMKRYSRVEIADSAKALESDADNYANVAKTAFDALGAFAEDVRAGRQIKGTPPAT